MNRPNRCPDCGSNNIKFVGRIPAADSFAGRKLSEPILGGILFHCQRCYLGFRWPRMTKDLLEQLYVQGSEKDRTMPPERRPDWSIAHDWIRSVYPSKAKVLDVGCFRGDFLYLHGDNYQKYGIEIHPFAQKHLATRGIKLVGADIDALGNMRQTFDCITAFDFIEHIASPKKFLSQCLEALTSVGHILVSTGNLDAPAFRFMGSHYWYCTIAEHISFISPRWCHEVAKELGLHVTRLKTFAHGSNSLKLRIKEPIKNAFHKFMPHFFSYLRRRGWGKKDAKRHPELAGHPPVWESASDHFMVLFSR